MEEKITKKKKELINNEKICVARTKINNFKLMLNKQKSD